MNALPSTNEHTTDRDGKFTLGVNLPLVLYGCNVQLSVPFFFLMCLMRVIVLYS